MKRTMQIIVSITCVASASFALAAPKDITTRTNPDGSLNVEARYTVHAGFSAYNGGMTSANSVLSRGLLEYHSAGGVTITGLGNWGRMNNGGLTIGDDGITTACTYGGSNPDYVGYLFNCGAKNLTKVKFYNRTFGVTATTTGAGGTFAATPELQYLDAPEPTGTWHTISAVTWSTPYNPSLTPADEVRAYEIAINETLSNVWGIRLIGDGNPAGADTVDLTGWVGVQELSVEGELEIGDTVLSKNKARSGTAGASTVQDGYVATTLNDGIFTAYMTTWNTTAQKEDWLSINWVAPQHGVTALGFCNRNFTDGGNWDDCQVPLRIEYTTTTNATWTPVTGLDKRRYPYLWMRLFQDGDAQAGFLFTFDELNYVTGLRIIGDPNGRSGDEDGFVGCYELEVFGKRVLAEIVNYDASVDGDVDAADVGLFLNCWSGPMVPYTTGCADRDLDQDSDVDEDDFGIFQRCYSGPGIAADVHCG